MYIGNQIVNSNACCKSTEPRPNQRLCMVGKSTVLQVQCTCTVLDRQNQQRKKDRFQVQVQIHCSAFTSNAVNFLSDCVWMILELFYILFESTFNSSSSSRSINSNSSIRIPPSLFFFFLNLIYCTLLFVCLFVFRFRSPFIISNHFFLLLLLFLVLLH